MKKLLFFLSFYLGAVSCGCTLGFIISLTMGANVNVDTIIGFFIAFVICLWTHLYVRHKIASDESDFAEPELDLQDFVDSMIAKDTEEKEIHFYKDYPYDVPNDVLLITHNGTKWAVENSVKVIHTTALTMLSFDLLDDGYRIFLHENDKVLECKPGMEGTEKDIRYEHNIFKLIRGRYFDNYFNEKPYLDNSEFDWGHNVKHNSEEL
jgi:hypothetical protein